MLKDFESDMVVGIRKLGNPTRKPAESNNTAKQTAGSSIVTLQVQAKNPICKSLHAYLCSCIQGQIAKTDRVKLHLGTAQCSSLQCIVLSLLKNC